MVKADAQKDPPPKNEVPTGNPLFKRVKKDNLSEFQLCDIPAGVYVSTEDGKILDCNTYFAQIFGYDRKEILHRTMHEFYCSNVEWEIFISHVKTQGAATGESRRWKKDNCIWVLESAVITESTIHGIVMDITDYKQKDLRESEELYKTLVKISPEAVMITDLNGVITNVSEKTLALHGFEHAEELIGKNVLSLIALKDHEKVLANMSKPAINSVKNVEYTMVRKDRSFFTGVLNASVVKDASGVPTAFIATVRDISDRNRMEEELKKSEEKYRSFVQNLQGIAYRGHMDWTPIFFHGAVEEITGYTEEEFISASPRWDQVIHPDDWSPLEKSFEHIQKTPHYSTNREYRIIRKDGKVRWVQEFIQNLCDSSGNPVSVHGMIYDITDRKTMNEKLRQAYDALLDLTDNLEKKVIERTKELIKANQLKSEFLANMSHEFRTPLNSILSFAELLLLGLDGPVTEQQKQDLEMIKESGQELLGLVGNLLDLSKIEAGKVELLKESVDVEKVIAVVSSQLAVKAVEKGLFLTTAPVEVDCITADEARLKQILRNLAENAVKFTEKGGVTIGAHERGNDVVFWVEDTGCGITEKDQHIIFDKFSQAQKGTESGGTGLGLSVAKELVELHGGKIWVESERGKGSTFFFSIPAV